jgi:hypothetical protein
MRTATGSTTNGRRAARARSAAWRPRRDVQNGAGGPALASPPAPFCRARTRGLARPKTGSCTCDKAAWGSTPLACHTATCAFRSRRSRQLTSSPLHVRQEIPGATAASASSRARDGNPLLDAGWDRLRNRTLVGRALRGTSSWIPTQERRARQPQPVVGAALKTETVAQGGPLSPVGGGSLSVCRWGPRRRCRGLGLRCRRLLPGDWGHARNTRPTGLAARLRALPVAAERLPHCLDLTLLPHTRMVRRPRVSAGFGKRFVKRRRGTGQAIRSHRLPFPRALELTVLQVTRIGPERSQGSLSEGRR